MQDFKSLETPVLLDMLSHLTVKHIGMLQELKMNAEFEELKATIKAIQSEIESRQSAGQSQMEHPDAPVSVPDGLN